MPASRPIFVVFGKTGTARDANPDVGSAEKSLDGRTALVTGGGRGIGRAVAVRLADAGARVAVLARSDAQLRQTTELIGQRGGTARAVPADVTDQAQCDDAVGAVVRDWGAIQVLVNNAAVVWPLGPTASLDPGQWAAAVAVNLTAPVRLTLMLLPDMLRTGWGRIVNVSSGVAANPVGMLRANGYVTTKAALEAHTLNLAAELDGSGVTVNVFRPGVVDTAMQAFIRDQDPERVGAALHQRFVRNHEQGALLTPDQSAASLLARLSGTETGRIWDVNDRPTTEGDHR